MSTSSILQQQLRHTLSTPLTFRPNLQADLKSVMAPGSTTRDRIWDLSSNLHCSVVGTCLTTGDLRQFFARMNAADARTASDHDLHSRAVQIAGLGDFAGKQLNKMLDRKHETTLRRFAKAKTTEELRALWQEALDRGDIPGAYWATLTHPAADRLLVTEVFGEVHMLSHLVGMSNRADIARLRQLETALAERDEKIARQEERLRRSSLEKAELTQRIDALELDARLRAAAETPKATPLPDSDAKLVQKLADEQARTALLTARTEEQDQALKAAEARIAELDRRAADLQAELSALEASVDALTEEGDDVPETTDLAGLTLLYVGGRPKLVEQLRALAARRGGTLIAHDGGIEDTASLLPGLVSQADAAFFPVDCISHHAAGQLKRLCREAGKPFVPLRSASLASFIAATSQPDVFRADVFTGQAAE